MEKLLSGSKSKIIGYYYANESATAPRLSYINQLVESIRTNTSTIDGPDPLTWIYSLSYPNPTEPCQMVIIVTIYCGSLTQYSP